MRNDLGRETNRKPKAIGIALVPLLLTAALLSFENRTQLPLEPTEKPPAVDVAVTPRTPYDHLIRNYADRYGVERSLVKAVMHAESGFRARVRSQRGARGLMQMMPRTARAYGVRNLYDPNQNVRAGVRYLRFLLDRHNNDPKLAVAAYNAGSSAVKRYGGVPPFPETRRYVAKVMAYRDGYRQLASSTAG